MAQRHHDQYWTRQYRALARRDQKEAFGLMELYEHRRMLEAKEYEVARWVLAQEQSLDPLLARG